MPICHVSLVAVEDYPRNGSSRHNYLDRPWCRTCVCKCIFLVLVAAVVVVASATDASDTDHARRLMCTDNLRSQAPANQCRLKGEQHGSNCVPGLHVNGASSRAPSSLLDAVSHRPGRRRSPVAPPEFEPPPRPDQPAATPGRRLAQRREGRAAHPSPTVSAKATLGSAVPTFEATRAASCAALPFPQRHVPPSIGTCTCQGALPQPWLQDADSGIGATASASVQCYH